MDDEIGVFAVVGSGGKDMWQFLAQLALMEEERRSNASQVRRPVEELSRIRPSIERILDCPPSHRS